MTNEMKELLKAREQAFSRPNLAGREYGSYGAYYRKPQYGRPVRKKRGIVYTKKTSPVLQRTEKY